MMCSLTAMGTVTVTVACTVHACACSEANTDTNANPDTDSDLAVVHMSLTRLEREVIMIMQQHTGHVGIVVCCRGIL